MAFALTELVRKEKASMTVDLHEARPMNPIVNCIIADERAAEIGAMGVMDLAAVGIKIRLEPSPKKLRGMTHRELGEFTPTLAILMETANPVLDKLHGRLDESLVLKGQDDFLQRADTRRLLYAPYGDKGYPLKMRVGRHLTAFSTLVQIMSELHPENRVEIENIPDHEALQQKDVGAFLRPAGA